MAKGIHDLAIHDAPIAVLDFETTGLTPGLDRVVEISVWRIEPGASPVLAFDTLVNPERPMAASEIHGITDEDVAGAPVFADVAGAFAAALSDAVVTAYNVYFDMRFLRYEFDRVGIGSNVPHFCLMYMRPLLDLGCRCNLETACQEHGIAYETAHMAAIDAEASAGLMRFYLDVLRQQNIRTFGDLTRRKNYKFFQSFDYSPLGVSAGRGKPNGKRLLSRATGFTPAPVDPERQAVADYWEGLRSVLADLEISDDEQTAMIEIRSRLQIPKERIRMLHARAFASVICQCIDDKWLDDKEVAKLRRLHACLSRLGWAPGE